MMIADALVPNWHQDISNHHADLTVMYHYKDHKKSFATYNHMLLSCGPIEHDILYNTAATEADYESECKLTKDTPYLDLTGEL